VIDLIAAAAFGAFALATIGAILWRYEERRRDRAWMAETPFERLLAAERMAETPFERLLAAERMAETPFERLLAAERSKSELLLLRGGLITINEARGWRLDPTPCPPDCDVAEVAAEVSLSGHERAHWIRCPEHAPANPGQATLR
jgi:hypothetical protein